MGHSRVGNDSQEGVTVGGHGPTIVLLHSAMASKSQWRSLIELMCASHRLIAIDLSSYGVAPFPESAENFCLASEVRHIEAVLAGLMGKRERFYLVGHSYGGAVALRYAYQHQNRVRGLVLFEPVAFHVLNRLDIAMDDIDNLVRHLAWDIARNDIKAATKRYIDFWSGDGAYASMPQKQRWTMARLMPKVLLDFRALMTETLNAKDYRRISVPTCLIGGVLSKRAAHHILATLAASMGGDCELHWVRAAHMAPVTHASEVNAIIERFIGGATLAGGDADRNVPVLTALMPVKVGDNDVTGSGATGKVVKHKEVGRKNVRRKEMCRKNSASGACHNPT